MLYEEVDESKVDKVVVGLSSPQEYYRFPRAGQTNATSSLKIIYVKEEGTCITKSLPFSFAAYFPWCEYIPRIGWTPCGKNIWAQVLDRRQRRLETIVFPLDVYLTQYTTFPPIQVSQIM